MYNENLIKFGGRVERLTSERIPGFFVDSEPRECRRSFRTETVFDLQLTEPIYGEEARKTELKYSGEIPLFSVASSLILKTV